MFDSILKKAENAKLEKENRSSGGGKFLFPGDGTTQFRLLMKPDAKSLMRVIKRHWSNEQKKHIPCLDLYGLECPICKVKKELEEKLGKDPGWKFNAQRKAIAHVTVGATSNKDEKGPKEGESAVLLMPISAYDSINDMIVQFKDNLADLLMAPSGIAINITKGKSNNRVEYKTVADPFKKVKTAEDEAGFMEIVEGLEDIENVMFPAVVSDDIISEARKEANLLRKAHELPQVDYSAQGESEASSTENTGDDDFPF